MKALCLVILVFLPNGLILRTPSTWKPHEGNPSALDQAAFVFGGVGISTLSDGMSWDETFRPYLQIH